MQKPVQIPVAWAKRIARILFGSILLFALIMTVLIIIWWHKENKATIKNLEVQGAVISIRQPDHHNTKWYVAQLSDGKSIVLEDAMRGVLLVGDSLFKKKGENYYTMKQRSGKITRIRLIQP